MNSERPHEHFIILSREKGSQEKAGMGRAYPNRIPRVMLKCVSEKWRSELATQLGAKPARKPKARETPGLLVRKLHRYF